MTTAPQKYLFDTKSYHLMGKANILPPEARIELIEGELIQMAPIGPIHADIVTILAEQFQEQNQKQAQIRTQNPLQLGEFSEPEPDIALVYPHRYREHHPTAEATLLVVEIADSSLKNDIEIVNCEL